MKTPLNRREFFKASLAASAASGLSLAVARPACAIDYSKPVPEANGLTVYHNGANILVRWNNLPLLGYRAHPTLKYPYFCPLNGPTSGLPLTTESALPYPHHRSLWLGCEPVNGGDYWSHGPLERGQIRSVELKIDEQSLTKTSAAFTQRCRWVREGANSPLVDERHFVVSVRDDRLRLIDCQFKLTAQENITIAKAKHSFFALRAAPDISPAYGGVLMNSEGGVGAAGTYGKPAAWCGYHGKRAQHPDVVEGIAIMNHPDNFDGHCPWFTRDYGNLSPSPFNFLKAPWRLPQGESIELKYRVALHTGDPKDAQLDKVYQQWIGKHS